MKKAILILALAGSSVLSAQDKPKPEAPPISDSLKARFWKAQAEFQSATAAAEKANQDAQQKQTALTAVVGLIQTACGDNFQPAMDKDQNPVCTAKPKPETKVPEKK